MNIETPDGRSCESRRRPQWRGERRPVTARVDSEVAEALAALALRRGCSVSDVAAEFINEGLDREDAA